MSCNFLTVKAAKPREKFMDCFPAADSQQPAMMTAAAAMAMAHEFNDIDNEGNGGFVDRVGDDHG